MKGRFVNLRFPVVTALTIVLGILTGFLFVFYELDLIWLVAFVPVFLIPVIIFIIKLNKKLIILSAILFAVFAGGVLNCVLRLESYSFCEIAGGENYHIRGTVDEKKQSGYGEYLILKNATADGINLGGKVRVALSENYGEFCDVGYAVEFDSKLEKYELFEDGKLGYHAQNDVKYYCYGAAITKSEYGFSLFGSMRAHIKNVLYDNLDKETAAVCYGMLIGDTSGMDDNSLQNFRYGGIAHIFAVSGLHIGLVYGILAFILKRTGANKYLAAGVQLFAILFYSGLCGFTLSSVRAVIMCGVAAVAKLLYVKRDGLNALATAVFLILCVTPLSLFSVGFQLSVCAVGGIMLFSSEIKKLLVKIKIPKGAAGGIALSLGATAGTLPVSAVSFGYVSGAGFLLNIVILPLLSLLFEIMFVATLICAIIPPLGVILAYAALPLDAVLSFLIAAGFERAIITGFGDLGFLLLYNAAALIISDKLNFKPAYKLSVFCVALALTVTYIVIFS